MKKLLSLALVIALCALALCGCKKGDSAPEETAGSAPVVPDAPDVTDTPDEGYHGEEDQSAALEEMPTLAPVEPLEGADVAASEGDEYFSIEGMLADSEEDAPEAEPAPEPQGEAEASAEGEAPADGEAAPTSHPAVDTSTYQFSALTDTSLGFTFNYPSHWENLPGVYTICYREKVEPGDFPARVAITAKRLVHTPDEEVMLEELSEYMRLVHKQYEAATFQAGTPNADERFLDKPAMSNTYLAYSGENEVKGFIIGTNVGRVVYVFHFCAAYEDYAPMESMMRYMIKSCEIVERD